MTTRSFITLTVPVLFYIISSAHGNAGKTGKEIFDDNCAKCHGQDGTKGRWGAKNLQKSILSDQELVKIISEGKSFMPSWKKKLTGEELRQVVSYVKLLRK